MKNTVAVCVGHLVEVRSEAGYRTVADVDRLFDEFRAVTSTWEPGTLHATIVDHRHCPIMSPEVAARFSQHLVSVNERTTRSATLANRDSASASLQYSRVVKDAGYANRRIFTNESAAVGWLAAVLSAEERTRLIRFIDEGTRTSEFVESLLRSSLPSPRAGR